MSEFDDAGTEAPCKNPNCKSYGRPHPNCRCYGGYAEGGIVKHYCSMGNKHESTCEYFAEGGDVEEALPPKPHPLTTKGYAAVHHGLHGLLTKVGNATPSEPEKYKKMHNEVVDAHNGKRIRSSSWRTGLQGILGHLAESIVTREANPAALKGSVDYLDSANKGMATLKNSTSDLFDKSSKNRHEPDENSRENLKKYLSDIEVNPSQLLEVGGSLGHYLPDDASQLAASLATATQYLNSIKPRPHSAGPLDEVIKPDKAAEMAYDRQLDIAEKPMLLLQHVKDGTLMPQDIETVKMIYPGLYESMVSEASEALITAKSKDMEIPYKQKQSLSMFLDQPLDATQTPEAMQAIIKSQGVQQAQRQAKKNDRTTSEAELKQINKVDKLSETTLESRLINRNEKGAQDNLNQMATCRSQRLSPRDLLQEAIDVWQEAESQHI